MHFIHALVPLPVFVHCTERLSELWTCHLRQTIIRSATNA